jgi:hypothetical protein
MRVFYLGERPEAVVTMIFNGFFSSTRVAISQWKNRKALSLQPLGLNKNKQGRTQ